MGKSFSLMVTSKFEGLMSLSKKILPWVLVFTACVLVFTAWVLVFTAWVLV